MKLIEHPDREALTLAVAQEMTEALGMALKTRDRAVLCLPGGSTPIPVFKALAAARPQPLECPADPAQPDRAGRGG
jgi:6-phosphogluconolactonase